MTPEEREKWGRRLDRVRAHKNRLEGELVLGKLESFERDRQFHERIDLQLRVYTLLRRAMVGGSMEGVKLFVMMTTDAAVFSLRLQNLKGMVTVSLYAQSDRTKWSHWSTDALVYRDSSEDKRPPHTWKSVFEDEDEQGVVDWIVRRLGRLEDSEPVEES